MQSIAVLFGTESGNAQGLAKRAGEVLRGAGHTVEIIDMADFEVDTLPSRRIVLVITSTYGNGDPPSNAEALHAYLMKRAPKMESLVFSVCALGDTTYERFAQCGKDFDKRLGELGATRLVERQDCDVDYDAPFDAWLDKVKVALGTLDSQPAAEKPATPVVSAGRAVPPAPPSNREPLGSRRNPVNATVLANTSLFASVVDTAEPTTTSIRDTRHIALDVHRLPAGYEPGDSIGIWPENDPQLVDEILRLTKLDPEAPVQINHSERSLRETLLRSVDVQHVDIRLVERLLGPVAADQRHTATQAYHVVDLVSRTPPEPWTAATFVDMLRPLAPRLYSVASSPRTHSREVHLAAAIVRYRLADRDRMGVASRFLLERAKPGAELSIYLQPAPHFRLAAVDRDIVMIGPGTGIAPFRAFLEDRAREIQLAAGGAKVGRTWLFFRARHRATEFLYRSDLEAFQRDSVLTRLDLAFSRDQESRVYVQHRMRESSAELFRWIRDGAVIYVCGDAKRMAPDVHATLIDILAKEGAQSEEAARAELDRIATERRYQRDVY